MGCGISLLRLTSAESVIEEDGIAFVESVVNKTVVFWLVGRGPVTCVD
jgi:hypothetical protein